MKKLIMLILVLVALFLFTFATWALNTPEVIQDHGVIDARYVNGTGLIIGGEYGFADKLAFTADIGESSYARAAIKYELNPNLALEAGLNGSGSSQVFFGINGAASMSHDLEGIFETDLSIQDNELNCNYELGLKINLDAHYDIRGGLMGSINNTQSTNNLELELGYRF